MAKPLFDIVGSQSSFIWGEDQENAFNELKNRLTSAPIIKQFDPKLRTILYVDSSGLGIGSVLEQIDTDGISHVIEYASRTLRNNERKYPPTELECCGLIWSIEHFRHYLLGIDFHVVTDHHALCWLQNISNRTGKLDRWALQLAEYSFSIEYKKGRDHKNADCLSRYFPEELPPEKSELLATFRMDAIARLQKDDKW